MHINWKLIMVLGIIIAGLCTTQMMTSAESRDDIESSTIVTEPTEGSLATEPTEQATTPHETLPTIPLAPAPSETVPETTAPTEQETEPEESDFITDIQVKLYNSHKEDFNQVDGAEYCKDIAALLTKHAVPGMRIGAGCAMAYTEGGAGKQWGVYARTNNCFGIRATKSWSGWVYSRQTKIVYKDYETAVAYGETDFFRAYPTMEDSVKDYIRHLQNKRYGKCLEIDNDEEYLWYIINQGYGPDTLPATWMKLIKMYDLTQYDIDWSKVSN